MMLAPSTKQRETLPIESGQWYEGSFVIALSLSVSEEGMKRMEVASQERAGNVIVVSSGKARDTWCGMLEFRTSSGMPFGWNKRLVDSVTSESGTVLWSR